MQKLKDLSCAVLCLFALNLTTEKIMWSGWSYSTLDTKEMRLQQKKIRIYFSLATDFTKLDVLTPKDFFILDEAFLNWHDSRHQASQKRQALWNSSLWHEMDVCGIQRGERCFPSHQRKKKRYGRLKGCGREESRAGFIGFSPACLPPLSPFWRGMEVE